MTTVTFVDPRAAEDFECRICLGTIHNAVQIGCNDHLFCERCIVTYSQSHSDRGSSFPCPICRAASTKRSIVRVKGMDRQINKLQVKCPNHNSNTACLEQPKSITIKSNKKVMILPTKPKVRRSKRLAGKKRKTPDADADEDDDGKNDKDDDDNNVNVNHNTHKKQKLDTCEWTGCYGDLQRHIDSCQYQVVRCKWCKMKMMRHQCGSHVNKCPLCEIPCRQCNANIARSAMNRHLTGQCPMRLVACVLCGNLVVSQRMNEHYQATCQEWKISCRYRAYGCMQMVKRKDTQKHYREGMETHLQQVTSKYVTATNMFARERTRFNQELAQAKGENNALQDELTRTRTRANALTTMNASLLKSSRGNSTSKQNNSLRDEFTRTRKRADTQSNWNSILHKSRPLEANKKREWPRGFF